jgi:hypothetical protein
MDQMGPMVLLPELMEIMLQRLRQQLLGQVVLAAVVVVEEVRWR